ncbi:calcium-binding protein [Dictyostelium discoideum AX4]|uniref:Isoform B of Calcium-binding protein 4b n=1 Tax=Dictyostelium discoideum TaxID=44689 RepID=Q9GYD9-2|nr:calcium-binding protein [Dictyostelium discoideum AX4]EAL65871.1 calcium-binding protein [Dictyostelium discoideum AX4]|eukprot:XP_639252.1 calcium-binding protein [Dictyostelium discoideum AX4]
MVTKKEFLEELTNATNEAIKAADKNGDNQLSKKEVNDMYKKCKYPNPTLATNSLFELFDLDKDGKLSVNEVKTAVLVDYIIEAETCLKKFVDIIFKADSNKDNKITWDEARQYFITSGSNEAQAKVLANSMFEDVDSDDDKCITREELREVL